jgi:hypothetical protein
VVGQAFQPDVSLERLTYIDRTLQRVYLATSEPMLTPAVS